MAKPRVFISSTFYDLKQVRADLDLFIETLGYEAVRNEEGDISYGNEEELEDYCYKEISSVDIFISIIGGRYGCESVNQKGSISQSELRTALKEGKQVYIFIEKNVLAEYETYLLNKELKNMKYSHVDDERIYAFIEEIKSLGINNSIKDFETASNITKYLKIQFAGLFQRFLQKQTQEKEASIITNLEKTAQTLNKLVTYLSDENEDKSKEINKILMINHPLISDLRKYLKIKYSFYVEKKDDLSKLLEARGFSKVNSDSSPFIIFIKENNRKQYKMKISNKLFDDRGRLKFYKNSDWVDSYCEFVEVEKNEDDLPF